MYYLTNLLHCLNTGFSLYAVQYMLARGEATRSQWLFNVLHTVRPLNTVCVRVFTGLPSQAEHWEFLKASSVCASVGRTHYSRKNLNHNNQSYLVTYKSLLSHKQKFPRKQHGVISSTYRIYYSDLTWPLIFVLVNSPSQPRMSGSLYICHTPALLRREAI